MNNACVAWILHDAQWISHENIFFLSWLSWEILHSFKYASSTASNFQEDDFIWNQLANIITCTVHGLWHGGSLLEKNRSSKLVYLFWPLEHGRVITADSRWYRDSVAVCGRRVLWLRLSISIRWDYGFQRKAQSCVSVLCNSWHNVTHIVGTLGCRFGQK